MIQLLTNVAALMKVSPSLLIALCTTESNLRNVINHDDGGSPSYGVCQIKLDTAKMFVPKISAAELMVPEMNAAIAARYLKWQLNRYDGRVCRAVAAYNSGSIKFNKNGNFINYKYVRKVLKNHGGQLSCNRQEST